MFDSIEFVFGNRELLLSLNALLYQSVFFDIFIHFSSRYLEILLIAGAALFIFFHHDSGAHLWYGFRGFVIRMKEVLYISAVAVFSWTGTWILKAFFLVPRPYQTFSNLNQLYVHDSLFDSFPSGHATFFAALAMAIWLVHPRTGILFVLGALCIGFGRIVAGIHYPIDILAGYCIGATLAYVFFVLGKRIRKTQI